MKPLPALEAYLRALLRHCEDITLPHFFRAQRPRWKLEDSFVRLSVVENVPEPWDALSTEELLERRRPEEGNGTSESVHRPVEYSLRDLRRRRDAQPSTHIARVLREHREPVVLLGHPGSGKTTLLRCIAYALAKGPKAMKAILGESLQEPLPTPILLTAASLPSLGHYELEDLIDASLGALPNRSRLGRSLHDELLKRAEAGQVLFLIDGLDEIRDANHRRGVAEGLSNLIHFDPELGNRVLLSSRIIGYREAPLTGDIREFELLDLSPDEQERLVVAFYVSRSRTTQPAIAKEQAQRLLKEVRGEPALESLVTTPLLLVMLSELRLQRLLPKERAGIYRSFLRFLVKEYPQGRRGKGQPSPLSIEVDALSAVLAPLAYALISDASRQTLPKRRALEIIGHPLERSAHLSSPAAPPPTPEMLLTWLIQEVGLLNEPSPDSIGFIHLTFAEFFAAEALASLPESERWARLRPRLHLSRWRQPQIFLASILSLSDRAAGEGAGMIANILAAESAFEGLLQRDTFLASDWCLEGLRLPNDLAREMADRLWSVASKRDHRQRTGKACLALARLLSRPLEDALHEATLRILLTCTREAASVRGQVFNHAEPALWRRPQLIARLWEEVPSEDVESRRIILHRGAHLIGQSLPFDAYIRALLGSVSALAQGAADGLLEVHMDALLPAQRAQLQEVAEKLRLGHGQSRRPSGFKLGLSFMPPGSARDALLDWGLSHSRSEIRRIAVETADPALPLTEARRERMHALCRDSDDSVAKAAITFLHGTLGPEEDETLFFRSFLLSEPPPGRGCFQYSPMILSLHRDPIYWNTLDRHLGREHIQGSVQVLVVDIAYSLCPHAGASPSEEERLWVAIVQSLKLKSHHGSALALGLLENADHRGLLTRWMPRLLARLSDGERQELWAKATSRGRLPYTILRGLEPAPHPDTPSRNNTGDLATLPLDQTHRAQRAQELGDELSARPIVGRALAEILGDERCVESGEVALTLLTTYPELAPGPLGDLLRSLNEHSDALVRTWALRAIEGQEGLDAALEAAKALINQGSRARALVIHHAKNSPALAGALVDEILPVAKLPSQFESKAAVDYLCALPEWSDAVRQTLFDLTRTGDYYVTQAILEEWLRRGEDLTRVLEVLGEHEPESAQNPDAWWLQHLGEHLDLAEVYQCFLRALRSRNRQTREHVVRAIDGLDTAHKVPFIEIIAEGIARDGLEGWEFILDGEWLYGITLWFGSEVFRPLILDLPEQALHHPDVSIRTRGYQAWIALWLYEKPEVIWGLACPLSAILSEEDEELWSRCGDTLTRFIGPNIFVQPTEEPSSESADSRVRAAAAGRLLVELALQTNSLLVWQTLENHLPLLLRSDVVDELGAAAMVAHLLRAQGHYPQNAALVLEALSHDAHWTPWLEWLSNHKDPEVRDTACRALLKLGSQYPDSLPLTLSCLRRGHAVASIAPALDNLFALSPGAWPDNLLPLLLELLDSGYERLEERILPHLERELPGRPELYDALLARLGLDYGREGQSRVTLPNRGFVHRSRPSRLRIATLVGAEASTPERKDGLLKKLKDPDWRVRQGAVMALGASIYRDDPDVRSRMMSAAQDLRGPESLLPRLTAARYLINDPTYGPEALKLAKEGLTFGQTSIFHPRCGGEINRRALETLKFVKAEALNDALLLAIAGMDLGGRESHIQEEGLEVLEQLLSVRETILATTEHAAPHHGPAGHYAVAHSPVGPSPIADLSSRAPEMAQQIPSHAYDAFISHSNKDKAWVRPFVDRLKKVGVSVWFDEAEIRWGESIRTAVLRGLKASRHVILILSPHSLGDDSTPGSEWVELETVVATVNDPVNKRRRLLPLLIADCELPDDLKAFRALDLRAEGALDDHWARILETLKLDAAEEVVTQKPLDPPKAASPMAKPSQAGSGAPVSVAPTSPTHVVCLTAPIGGRSVVIGADAIDDALTDSCRLGTGLEVDLDERGPEIQAGTYGAIAQDLHTRAQAFLRETVKPSGALHLSIFALGPIPLLFALGAAIDDVIPADVYNLHREPQGWRWPEDQAPLRYEFIKPPGRPRSGGVALALSISGAVGADKIVEAAPTVGRALYEIRIPNPTRDRVRCAEDVKGFRLIWERALDGIREEQGEDVRIHLFPAVPVALAVEAGRRLVQASPRLIVYEWRNGRWHGALNHPPEAISASPPEIRPTIGTSPPLKLNARTLRLLREELLTYVNSTGELGLILTDAGFPMERLERTQSLEIQAAEALRIASLPPARLLHQVGEMFLQRHRDAEAPTWRRWNGTDV